jgi:glyoxylase-like metal-dependent hydrolase (beta-lactamase superfamily II)
MFLPTAARWYALEALDPTLYRITEPYLDALVRANVTLVKGRDRDLLFDGGMGVVPLRPFLASRLQADVVAVCSHAHIDHVGALHEFETRLVHPLEADALAHPSAAASLFAEDLGAEFLQVLVRIGYGMPPPLFLTALPYELYDPGSYVLQPAPATGLIGEGDVVDQGDRRWTVLHLPGHAPGQIGLVEERTGILLAGDAIYDGTLLHLGPGTSLDDYVRTLDRLRRLDVWVVHGGHGPSFDRQRLVELCESNLRAWGA